MPKPESLYKKKFVLLLICFGLLFCVLLDCLFFLGWFGFFPIGPLRVALVTLILSHLFATENTSGRFMELKPHF